jgi:hypothetical protein
MLKYFFSVFFIYCAICVYGQQPNKLRLPKNHTAVYTCAVNENYWVDQSVDSIKAVEKVVTCMQAEIAQDILEKKRNYLQVDYHQKNYTRIDSIFKPKGIKDTASNRGKTPLVKIILQYNRQGEYLGPTLAMLNPEYSLRDFRFFYNTAKQLIYTLNSTSRFKSAGLIRVSLLKPGVLNQVLISKAVLLSKLTFDALTMLFLKPIKPFCAFCPEAVPSIYIPVG